MCALGVAATSDDGVGDCRLVATLVGAMTSGLLFAACALREDPIVGAISATACLWLPDWWFTKQTALWKPGDEPLTTVPATSSVTLLTPPGS